MENNVLKWYGHAARMADNRGPKQIFAVAGKKK